MRKQKWGTLLLAVIVSVSGCAKETTKENAAVVSSQQTETDQESQKASGKTELDAETMFTDRDKEIGFEESDGVAVELDGSTAQCNSDTVKIAGGSVTITKEGTYILSGSLDQGSVIVDAGKTDKIQLVLNGVTIHCASSAAIYVKQADKVFLTLAKGTENSLSNSQEFVAIDENHIDGVIFSKDDLTLNGEGSLMIDAAYGHGIVSKDDLVITGGTYQITAAGHALAGKDSVRVANGNFALTAGKDGIHAENNDDSSLGFLYLAGGNFDMKVQSDGLDAAADLLMEGGSFLIRAGDDGVHSDQTVTIREGTITITESYEGIEGMAILVEGGTLSVKAEDDGLNAAGGNDQSGMGEGAEREKMSADENCLIRISGGRLEVNASGDGIDSNGNLYVSGGETYVYGPEDNRNGAIDYNGEAEISGGIFAASGASGMAQNFGDSSTQGSILAVADNTQDEGSDVVLLDSEGTVLLQFTCSKQYNSVLVSCPQIEKGKTYTLKMGTENADIEMTDIIYGASREQGGRSMGGGNARTGFREDGKGRMGGSQERRTGQESLTPGQAQEEAPAATGTKQAESI